MIIHFLKTLQPYYDAVVRGEEPFQVRKNDRNFVVGDIVCLREYVHPKNGDPHLTKREIWKKIVYMTEYGQQPGFAVFAIRNLEFDEMKKIISETNGRCFTAITKRMEI